MPHVDLRRECLEQDLSATRARVLRLLQRYGWSSTSFQVLEPGYRYFFADDDACVAYVSTARRWVAAGPPIAALERRAAVADVFAAAARSCGRRAAFALTSARFVAETGYEAFCIGQEPVWDPADWPQVLARSRNLREQLRRARAKGVTVRRVSAAELGAQGSSVRAQLDALIARWLASRSMAPMGFLVRVHVFEQLEERHFFVAETAQGVRGLLVLVPIYARAGFLVEDLFRTPDAPNGTTELLIDHALRSCAADGCRYVTLGLAPLAGDELPVWLRKVRRWGRTLYDFDGLRAYKAKFAPRAWQPIYLCYPRGDSALRALYALLSAFAGGSLVRFGIATMLRGPRLVVHALTLLLLPWTLALASIDARYFAPLPWLQWWWVAFDLALFAGLLRASLRFSARLVRTLSYLIAGDALCTLLETLLLHLPRVTRPLEIACVALSVAAPTLAAVVLHNVWRRSMSLGSNKGARAVSSRAPL